MFSVSTLVPSESIIRPAGHAAQAVFGLRGCLFTFHRVASPDVWETLPNRGYYLDLEFLDRLLLYLVRTGWAVVTIEEALRRSRAGAVSDRFVNFSVDDCYRDTFEDIVPLFREHKLPVTLYVTTGIPDGTMPMWYVGLEEIIMQHDFIEHDNETIEVDTPEAKREAYASIAADFDGPQSGERYAAFCKTNGVDMEAVHWRHAITWEMLESLSADPLVEIGSHTVLHRRISSLTPDEAMTELKGSRERMRERLGVAADHFSFPYGRGADCHTREFEMARAAGYLSAATTRKGLVRRGQDPFCLPRNTLNGAHRHLGMVELHLSGLTGAAAKVLGRV